MKILKQSKKTGCYLARTDMKDLLGVIYLGCFPVQACPKAHDFPPDGNCAVTLRTTQDWSSAVLLEASDPSPCTACLSSLCSPCANLSHVICPITSCLENNITPRQSTPCMCDRSIYLTVSKSLAAGSSLLPELSPEFSPQTLRQSTI